MTFNAALKPLVPNIEASDAEEIYLALSAYLGAFIKGSDTLKAKNVITKPPVFRAAMLLFTEVAQRVKDRFGKPYTVDNFYEVLKPMFREMSSGQLRRPGNSHKELYAVLSKDMAARCAAGPSFHNYGWLAITKFTAQRKAKTAF